MFYHISVCVTDKTLSVTDVCLFNHLWMSKPNAKVETGPDFYFGHST